MEIIKSEQLSQLYTFYGDLLTKKQQQYFQDYYDNDLSLGEIADNDHVSRQAVYDNLRRSTQSLQQYEGKLHHFSLYQQLDRGFSQILKDLDDERIPAAKEKLTKLQQLIQED